MAGMWVDLYYSWWNVSHDDDTVLHTSMKWNIQGEVSMSYTYDAGGYSSVSQWLSIYGSPYKMKKCVSSWEAVSILRRGEGIMKLWQCLWQLLCPDKLMATLNRPWLVQIHISIEYYNIFIEECGWSKIIISCRNLYFFKLWMGYAPTSKYHLVRKGDLTGLMCRLLSWATGEWSALSPWHPWPKTASKVCLPQLPAWWRSGITFPCMSSHCPQFVLSVGTWAEHNMPSKRG